MGDSGEIARVTNLDEKSKQSEARADVSKRKQAEWFDIDEKHNTYVYVSGLPKNLTEDEFIDLMKRYGIIAKKDLPGSPYNVKLYKNADGSFKGDALCRYIKVESVELAIELLDGYNFDSEHTIHCERAKFECKGSYDPKKKPRIDPRRKKKQKKAIDKLLSWEPKLPPEVMQKKVILKNMFDPQDIEKDPSLIVEIKEEVESQCTDLIAEPKRVDIYDKHPGGVIAVTFAEPNQAQACVDALNNKFYDRRVVTAELWDGKTKYQIRETDDESEKRLEKWKQDIQQSEDSEENYQQKIESTDEKHSSKEDASSSMIEYNKNEVDFE